MTLETEFHTELELRTISYITAQSTGHIINYGLPNGRIADIICTNTADDILIIEVKTCLSNTILEATERKYGQYCHYLYIAAPANCIQDILWGKHTLEWQRRGPEMGFLSITQSQIVPAKVPTRRNLLPSVHRYLRWHMRERLNGSPLGTDPTPPPA